MFACSATTSPPAWSAGAASGLAIAVRHDGCYAVTLASRPFLASAVPVEVVSDGVVRRPGAGLAISFNSSDRVGAFEAFAIEWTGSGVDLTTTFKRHTTTPRAAELGTSRATSIASAAHRSRSRRARHPRTRAPCPLAHPAPPRRRTARPKKMPEVDVLKITNEDAAFVLGKNGKTKEKIARVSGADLDLYEQSLTLEIRGSDAARGRAKKYVECVMAQRVGPVTIDDATDDDDLTCIQVPSEAVGFVTGSQGNFLRQVEEEWGTLMFFADFRGRNKGDQVPASSASTSQPPRPPPPLLHTLPRRLCAAVAG